MKCPKFPEHELTKATGGRGSGKEHHDCLACDLRFKECKSEDACKGFDALKQAARDAEKEVPTVPLMLYLRPGGRDENVRLYGEEAPIFRINNRTARCLSCKSEFT